MMSNKTESITNDQLTNEIVTDNEAASANISETNSSVT